MSDRILNGLAWGWGFMCGVSLFVGIVSLLANHITIR